MILLGTDILVSTLLEWKDEEEIVLKHEHPGKIMRLTTKIKTHHEERIMVTIMKIYNSSRVMKITERCEFTQTGFQKLFIVRVGEFHLEFVRIINDDFAISQVVFSNLPSDCIDDADIFVDKLLKLVL